MSGKMNRREMLKTSGLVAMALAGGGLAPLARGEGEMPGTPAESGANARPQAKGSVVFRRSIPVRYEVDVFIAGGGPAGVAAALAARSQGARVYLAEGHSCLGGMGTAARVPTFMQFTDGKNFLAGGVGRQVHDLWRKQAAALGCEGIDAESLKRIYDDLLLDAKVEFTFQTSLIGVECRGGRVDHVICEAPGGLFAVRAKTYVDATGNGDLAAWAGASFEKGDAEGNLMPGTLCSAWCDIDWEAWRAHRPAGPQPDGSMLQKAFSDGVFTIQDEHLTGMVRHGPHLGGGNIGHTFGVDGTDEVSLTRALLWGRKSMAEYERYYKQYLKGFEKMQLVATGSLLGIRETRRITGDYVLVLEDYKRRATFEDEIGRYAYPADLHPVRPGKDTYARHRREFDVELRYKPGESYGIPYRILTPRGLENVLVAGRCVSCDRTVFGSIRVMPGCFITGQAAGAAAALAAGQPGEKAGRTREVNVKELQRRLKAMGAYLPNAKEA